jgi:putative transcriptional regulator
VSVSYNKNVKHTLLYGGGYLNNRIKELRKEHKITQDELAGAVGVTRQTIISLENGKYNASLQLAYRIARYFDLHIEDVFVFEEEA